MNVPAARAIAPISTRYAAHAHAPKPGTSANPAASRGMDAPAMMVQTSTSHTRDSRTIVAYPFLTDDSTAFVPSWIDACS